MRRSVGRSVGWDLRRVLAFALFLSWALLLSPAGFGWFPAAHAAGGDGTTVLVVTGAAGAKEYAVTFAAAATQWKRAAAKVGAAFISIGDEADATADRDRLAQVVAREAKRGSGPLWLVLLGHGTFDGRVAKFNLRGPDLSSADLAAWLLPATRPLVILNTASASAPFLKDLTAPGRVVITATKTGSEQNATRLGKFLAAAIDDPTADLDKDGQISLLEAFLVAGARVQASFTEAGQLAPEHALLDDNGDGLGTPVTWYKGLQPTGHTDGNHEPDGRRAHQIHFAPSDPEKNIPADLRRRRDDLEMKVFKLRDARAQMSDDDYFAKLEPLLLEIARIYERAR